MLCPGSNPGSATKIKQKFASIIGSPMIVKWQEQPQLQLKQTEAVVYEQALIKQFYLNIGSLLKLVKRMLLKSIRSMMSWYQSSNLWASALNATDKALVYESELISGRRNPLYHEKEKTTGRWDASGCIKYINII